MTVTPTAGAVPPQNIEAEESVLGAMLLAAPAVDAVTVDVHLKTDDFYRDSHRLIYQAIRKLSEKSAGIDPLTVCAELEQQGHLDGAGGKAYVYQLASAVPTASNARHYARLVQDQALLRRLLNFSQKVQANVTDLKGEPKQLVEDAERNLFEVAHSDRTSDFRSLDDVLHEQVDRLEQLSRDGHSLTGTPSGFKDLDALTGGFQNSNLIVLAARPSMGKSALVANIAENVAVDHGRPVALFSLEMSVTELARRFIASRARIPGDKLRKGQVARNDWPKVVKACEKLNHAPIWIDDSSDIDILELRAKARRLHTSELDKRGGLGLIIVDYLQLMRADPSADSRVQQVGLMSRGLKILARELEVPVIAVSQLSRAPEQRSDTHKKPILSDLRESGQIEQDADLVMFIYREEYYNRETERQGIADILIAKHRNGPIGDVEMTFLSRYPKFANIARGEAPPLEQVSVTEGAPLDD